MTDLLFAPRGGTSAIEAGTTLMPHFDADGLVPAVATDADTGEALMFAWMNADALARTIATAEAHFWSRSRKRLWKKGEESGNILRVVEMRTDCDQDAIWMRVRIVATATAAGAACHTGRRSCFYRAIPLGTAPTPTLAMTWASTGPLFDPAKVYGQGKAG